MLKFVKSLFFKPQRDEELRQRHIQTLQTLRAKGKLDYIITEGPMELYNYLLGQFDENDVFASGLAKQLTSQITGFGIIPLRNIWGSIEKYIFVADKKFLLSLPAQERKQMIAHELGHVLDFESSDDIVQSYLAGSQDILEYEIRAWKKADELLSEGVNWKFAEECLDSYRRLLKQTPKTTNSKRLSMLAADVFERYVQIYVLTAESEEEKLTMQKRIREVVKRVRQLHGLI